MDDQARQLTELKARIFNEGQEADILQRNMIRESQGLGSVTTLPNLHKPLEALLTAADHKYAYKRLAERVVGHSAARTNAMIANIANRDGGNETKQDQVMINVPKEELDALLKDYATQERLLDGYHKENERLVRLMKERESEDNARKALFLDQQEELNKQLNLLRNQYGVPPDQKDLSQANRNVLLRKSYQKTAEQLRFELELDAKVRYLQEQLTEHREEAGKRERQLLHSAGNLRTENNDLRKELERLCNTDRQQLEEMIAHLQGENNRLVDKVQWHVDNARLVHESDEELSKLRMQINLLQQDILRRGGTSKQLSQLLEQSPGAAQDINTSILDRSTQSARTNSNKPHRNYADVKRIR